MPTFQFNKLVRDKFQKIYDELDQTIVSRRLSGGELIEQIRQKIIEEATELPAKQVADEEVISEMGDIQQALDDLRVIYGVSSEQVSAAQAKKFAKKGGFTEGLFVESITLKDDDEWIDYYRKDPVKYPEVTQVSDTRDAFTPKPQLPLGRYRHYKGGEYEVIMLACDETTLGWLVVYKPLYKHDGPDYWVRTYAAFTEEVEVDGKLVPRFVCLN